MEPLLSRYSSGEDSEPKCYPEKKGEAHYMRFEEVNTGRVIPQDMDLPSRDLTTHWTSWWVLIHSGCCLQLPFLLHVYRSRTIVWICWPILSSAVNFSTCMYAIQHENKHDPILQLCVCDVVKSVMFKVTGYSFWCVPRSKCDNLPCSVASDYDSKRWATKRMNS